MTFKSTEWEFSNEEIREEPARPSIVPGERYLFITNAEMIDMSGEPVYEINFEDLTNHATFRLRYWMWTAEKSTNNRIPNQSARNVLIGLGKALAGPTWVKGIPNPVDIIGGVVQGNVKINNKGYPSIYDYRPVNADIAALATIEQYSISEDEIEE